MGSLGVIAVVLLVLVLLVAAVLVLLGRRRRRPAPGQPRTVADLVRMRGGAEVAGSDRADEAGPAAVVAPRAPVDAAEPERGADTGRALAVATADGRVRTPDGDPGGHAAGKRSAAAERNGRVATMGAETVPVPDGEDAARAAVAAGAPGDAADTPWARAERMADGDGVAVPAARSAPDGRDTIAAGARSDSDDVHLDRGPGDAGAALPPRVGSGLPSVLPSGDARADDEPATPAQSDRVPGEPAAVDRAGDPAQDPAPDAPEAVVMVATGTPSAAAGAEVGNGAPASDEAAVEPAAAAADRAAHEPVAAATDSAATDPAATDPAATTTSVDPSADEPAAVVADLVVADLAADEPVAAATDPAAGAAASGAADPAAVELGGVELGGVEPASAGAATSGSDPAHLPRPAEHAVSTPARTAGRVRRRPADTAAEQAAADLALLRTFGVAGPGRASGPDDEETELAVRATGPAGPVGGIAQDVTVHVVGRTGIGIAGAAVTLHDHLGQETASVPADAGGRATLTAPHPGGYVLVAAFDGHQPGAAALTVADAGVEAEIVLTRSAGLSGTVTGEDGPQAGARVVLVQDGETLDAATTGAGGGYRFDDLTGGTYGLSVTVPDCEPAAVLVHVPDEQQVRHDIELEPAGLPDDVVASPF